MSKQRIKAGGADIELGVKSRLKEGLARAQKRLRAFGSVVAGIGGTLSATSGAITGSIAGAATSFANMGAMTKKVANEIGASVTGLSELEHAAKSTGTEVEDLHAGLREMGLRLGEAIITEGGAANDMLKKLGLSAQELASMNAEDAMMRIVDAVNQLPDAGQRSFAFDEIFGGDSEKMITLFAQGSKGIAELRAEAHKLGLVLSNEDAEAAGELKSAMGSLSEVFAGLVHKIGAAVAGPMTDFVSKAVDIISKTIHWVGENRALIQTVAAVAAVATAVGGALVGVGVSFVAVATAIGGAMSVASALSAVFAAILSPIGLVTAAIAGAAGYFLFFTESGKMVVDWFADNFGELKEIIGDTLSGIFDAIAGGNLALAGKIAFTGLKLAAASILESLTKLFGSSIQAMSRMIAELFKNVATLAARVNEARVSAVNWLADRIAGFAGVDNSLEKAEATRQAKAWSGAINSIDTSTLADSIAGAFDKAAIEEELSGFVMAAKDARVEAERTRKALEGPNAPTLPGAPNLPDLAKKAFGSLGGFSVAGINRSIPGKRNEEKLVKNTENTVKGIRDLTAAVRSSRMTFG